jgi:hypothetical protein
LKRPQRTVKHFRYTLNLNASWIDRKSAISKRKNNDALRKFGKDEFDNHNYNLAFVNSER